MQINYLWILLSRVQTKFFSKKFYRIHNTKDIIIVWCVFFKQCTKLTLHCNHRSGHLKTGHKESLLLLRRHLGNWSNGPVVSITRELLWRMRDLDSPRCWQCKLCSCRVRNRFLMIFLNRAILLCMPCICRWKMFTALAYRGCRYLNLAISLTL
jgi:hypothetical protein